MPARLRITEAEAFAMLEQAAAGGERCPKTGENGLTSTLTGDLARAGRIRIDVYPHNFRVVTIMEGPHRRRTNTGSLISPSRKTSPAKPQYSRISP